MEGLQWATATGFADLPANWPSLSAGGLVALIVILLVTGRGLATRREVDQANQRVDEANRRADRWESVALEALGQNRKLLIGAEIASEVIKALPAAMAERTGGRAAELKADGQDPTHEPAPQSDEVPT